MLDSGAGAQDGIGWNSQFLRDLVRRLKTNSWNILRQSIRVFTNLLNRLLAVKFVNADRAPGAHSVRMEEDHDLANETLFDPGFLDFATPARTDSADFLQTA